MKQYIILMAVAITAAFSSCSKEDEVANITPPVKEGKEVTIKIGNKVDTRAFFDNAATAEPWEKKINKATIILERYEDVTANPVEVVHRALTPTEIANGSVNVTLNDVNVGDAVVVAMAANVDVPSGIIAADLHTEVISPLGVSYYNGTFAEVATRTKNMAGFPLSGLAFAGVENLDEITIPLALQRSVAKIAVETTISDNFNNPNVYAGALRVNSIRVRTSGYYDKEFANCDTHTQASHKSGSKYQNLFYMDHSYNNDFTISATYDADGDFSTTGDQSPVTYVFSIEDGNGGNKEIYNNRYYRVALKINSLDEELQGKRIEVSVSVAEWLSVENHSVDIG